MHELWPEREAACGIPSRAHAILQRRSQEAAERENHRNAIQAEVGRPSNEVTPSQYQFPFLPVMASAMPTQWTRTGLFSNLKKGERRTLKNQILEGRSDCLVRMSGEELDMYDNDVFLHTIQLSQGAFPGEIIFFERSSFLRAIGRGSDLSSESYRRLHDSMERLTSATIFVQGQLGGESFRLIDKLRWGVSGKYSIEMDTEIVSIFANEFLAFIDMDVRVRLKSPLAKYLQNYIAGHQVGGHGIGCDKLRVWSGSRGRPRDFNCRALPNALGELEDEGVIRDWSIGEDTVRWTRIPHTKSRRP
ncbi:plasmid replication initiator TrfA [Pseudomonas urmiensis]|uniref:plasmid replication initiator TrfA n=1 Tax=Pseudomonas urmiensis TaxID=2745493 RepID=UPI003D14EFBA